MGSWAVSPVRLPGGGAFNYLTTRRAISLLLGQMGTDRRGLDAPFIAGAGPC